jgi:class 3 adenylate cyclase
MQFRILGPLEVLENQRALSVGGSKQRGILAVLLLNANQVVPSARLIDALWEERPPATASKALQVYVSQLRGKLGKDRLHTQAPGYLLRVAGDELDLARFETLFEQARQLEPEAAAAKLREALSLWRGPPLAEFAAQRFAQAGIARLEELRLACVEERIDADLARGRGAELVGELEGLVGEHPLRERLRAQLMLALYRSGRQAEALTAYQDARRVLVDELGIEPGTQLRKLEQAVLRQDASLEPKRPSEGRPAPAARPAAPSPSSAAAPAARRAGVSRKTVTVLFADVADSTALGERIDPETLRGALARWFDEARSVIERHGGTVEKYIGDSVMAVFGVPQLHEDDALRAVRAADDLGDALAGLNEQLERERGLRFTVRVGINTGEVVTGDGSGTLVTGDAVNVAKRLEEAGDGGDVIVGEATYELARTAAQFERLAPLALKGKSSRIRAWRLVSVDHDGLPYERRLDTPLVGRRRELEQLRRAFGRSMAERTCHLFTLLGAAGIGKTRLVCEFFDELEDEATVLRGRCLPYGDGITFWPLHDVIQELGGEANVMRLLAETEDGELVCERLLGEHGSQELFWAVRRLCETLARERPLVLCFEDVHWAEPTFLDLIEYLAGWIRDAPVFLVCLARPEFLDERPAWLSGQENAASVTLSPLSAAESKQLLDALGIAGASSARIAEAAEGNPLYAEQMAAMLAEGGDPTAIPPTIQSLLAARLDRLTPEERATIERAAVCGKEFWREAVVALTPREERGNVGSVLMSLVRKELVRPHRSAVRPDDAFRFGHVLIRDAAYTAIPKGTRAELHEGFAEWTESNAGDRMLELEEIIGYHLEQAFRYREQLGPLDDHARALGARAGELLGNAGRRAFARGDMPAAVTLLARSGALLPERQELRLQVLQELGSALMRTGDFSRADTALSEALAGAAAAGDKRLELRTLIEREFFRTFTHPETPTTEIVAVAERAIPLLTELGDELGLAKAWWLRSEPDVIAGRFGARAEALERALVHARLAGDARDESSLVALLAQALAYGPTPVPDAIRRCEELGASRPNDRAVEAAIASTLAGLHAMHGDFEEARRLVARAHRLYDEIGPRYLRAAASLAPASVELLAGDPGAAVRELRASYEVLEQMGESGVRSTIAAFLAQALVADERYDAAEEFAQISAQTGSAGDIVTQSVWRSAQAAALARKGEVEPAEGLAREAVELAKTTDFLDLQAGALLTHADVLRTAGRAEKAAILFEESRQLYERKGNIIGAQRAASLLADPVA